MGWLPENPIVLFATLFVVAYIGHVTFYVIGGLLIEKFVTFFPHRKIQDRMPKHKRLSEMMHGLRALVMSAACLAGALTVIFSGWTLSSSPLTIFNGVGYLVLLLILHDAWHYFEHRMMHTDLLYRWHHIHHTSYVPTVWTNDKFSLVDVFFIQSFLILVPFLLPVPWEILIAHRVIDQAKGMVGHSGFEFFNGRLARWPFPFICTIHHDAHHEKFKYNFANQFSVWDRVFGTLDPQYDERVEVFEGLAETRKQSKRAVQN